MDRGIIERCTPSGAARQRGRARARAWLARHPLIERVLRRSGCLSVHRRALARGVAVGLFVGLTPTVGLQTVLMLVACIALRANFPAAFLASWVSNPLTMGPLYLAYALIGEAVFGGLVRSLFELTHILAEALLQAIYLALGSLLIAVPAAALGYVLALAAHRYVALRRLRARQP
ncbi:MAG: DUF2062 domain-containing protein [Halofilum sp. (in: g-proteobacteria)]|nr:DUF2062 domain-containing protein [Halofilum sp. (in: g-proteobacteria)]